MKLFRSVDARGLVSRSAEAPIRTAGYNDAAASVQDSARIRSRGRGQSLVEFAVILPIFLLLVMGIVDFGWGLKSWISVTNAAREAARYGAVNCSTGTATTADVQQRAIDTGSGLGLTSSDVTVTNCETGTTTQSLLVKIEYEHQLITPIGGLMSLFGGDLPSSVTLQSAADMRIE